MASKKSLSARIAGNGKPTYSIQTYSSYLYAATCNPSKQRKSISIESVIIHSKAWLTRSSKRATNHCISSNEVNHGQKTLYSAKTLPLKRKWHYKSSKPECTNRRSRHLPINSPENSLDTTNHTLIHQKKQLLRDL